MIEITYQEAAEYAYQGDCEDISMARTVGIGHQDFEHEYDRTVFLCGIYR